MNHAQGLSAVVAAAAASAAAAAGRPLSRSLAGAAAAGAGTSLGILEVREYTLKPEGMGSFLAIAADTAPLRSELLPFLGCAMQQQHKQRPQLLGCRINKAVWHHILRMCLLAHLLLRWPFTASLWCGKKTQSELPL